MKTLNEERKILCKIIKDYDLEDIFNCDETGNPNFFLKKIIK